MYLSELLPVLLLLGLLLVTQEHRESATGKDAES